MPGWTHRTHRHDTRENPRTPPTGVLDDPSCAEPTRHDTSVLRFRSVDANQCMTRANKDDATKTSSS